MPPQMRRQQRRRWWFAGSAMIVAVTSSSMVLLLSPGQCFPRSSMVLRRHGIVGRGGNRYPRLAADASSSSSSFTLQDFPLNEVQEMEDLILSLSQEATDASRRGRVEALFRNKLAPPPESINPLPSSLEEGTTVGVAPPLPADAHFSTLFNLVLIAVGDRVRMQIQQQQLLQDPSTESDDSKTAVTLEAPGEASPTSFQLWALVDMMVQSKTLVKRARGELGKEGSFG